MSIGSFAAGSLIFIGKSTYKAAVRTGTLLAEGSDDFSARWEDPVRGFDAALAKVDADEAAYVVKSQARRAAALAKALAGTPPAAPVAEVAAPVAIVA